MQYRQHWAVELMGNVRDTFALDKGVLLIHKMKYPSFRNELEQYRISDIKSVKARNTFMGMLLGYKRIEMVVDLDTEDKSVVSLTYFPSSLVSSFFSQLKG